MKLNELFTDDDAVSPVIGVILMVAITVILAAVIGTFVLGLGEQVQSNAPSADFSFDQTGSDTVDITHTSGQTVDINNINVTGTPLDTGGTTVTCQAAGDWSDGDSDIAAGDTCTLENLGDDGTISVVWTSDDGSNSATLAEYDYTN